MSNSKGFGARLVGGNFGLVPSAKADPDTSKTTTPEPRSLSPKEAQNLMTAELLQAVRGVVESTTALTSKIGRQGATNGVLDVVLLTIPAEGCWSNDYPVTVGSIALVNHGAATMTVHSGPPMGNTPPTVGRGVQLCQTGKDITMPVGQRELTVWGTAGQQFSLQVFTGLQALGVGSAL
jgi:hypothetical protein